MELLLVFIDASNASLSLRFFLTARANLTACAHAAACTPSHKLGSTKTKNQPMLPAKFD